MRSATPGAAPKTRASTRDEAELEEHRQQRQDEHERPVRQHDAEVELHADGDEEQAEQDVVERPDVGLDLVLELGLRDQHAGDEGAERERQAGELGQPGEAERDQQQVEDEQLLALPAHDERQPPAHHDAAADEQHGEQRGRLQRGDGELAQQRLGRRAERGNQHQQRHDGQILEQQHGHHAPAVLAFELEAIGHQLDDDRRRAHRQRGAERDRALPAEPPVAAGCSEERDQRRVAGDRGERSSARPG